jgi:sortase A
MKYLIHLSPSGILLIILGGLLIGYPLYGILVTQAHVQQFNDEWEKIKTEVEVEENNKEKVQVERNNEHILPNTEISEQSKIVAISEIGNTQPTGLVEPSVSTSVYSLSNKKPAQDHIHSPQPIGRIMIPKIDLAAPIAEGVESQVLRYAVGHIKGSPPLGAVGNSALAGHRSSTYGEFFNRLDEVKVGDIVKIETLRQDFIYKVNDIKVVEPTDLSVLNDTSPKSMLTLITCTPKNSSRYRLIVSAEKVK